MPHVSKRLRGSIKRLPDLIDMEAALLSATSALECPVTLNPAKRHAALVATQRATNDFDITGIERGFIQSTQLPTSLGRGNFGISHFLMQLASRMLTQTRI